MFPDLNCAKTADSLYLARRRANAVKKLDNPKLAKFVLKRLMFRYSPEQIAGRLKSFADRSLHVSHETIYKWMYAFRSEGSPLFMYTAEIDLGALGKSLPNGANCG